jgi:Secretion system C-terminal sorting domain
MKKLTTIFLTVFLCQISATKAQITLQHTIDSAYTANWFYWTDIGNNDYKYVSLNAYANSFSVLNMDMTPYMTNIQIPPTGDSIMKGFTVIYVTKTLFDCDSTNIEYVYENPYDGFKHPFRVYRTDGTLLLQVDSANGPYCFGCYGGAVGIRTISNTSDGTKLFIQRYPNQIGQLLIYNLCGTLPVTVYDFSENPSFVKIFPNPTSGELNFEINPPNNQEEFELVIMDSNAKEASRKNVALIHNKYSMDVSNMSSGTYFYSLASKNKIYQSGKLVLTK